MTTQVLPSDPVISYRSNKQTRGAATVVEFGDSYETRGIFGITQPVITVTAVWENISDTEANTLESTFEAWNGLQAFTWTFPIETVSRTWVCDTWTRTPTGTDISTVSAEFRRVRA